MALSNIVKIGAMVLVPTIGAIGTAVYKYYNEEKQKIKDTVRLYNEISYKKLKIIKYPITEEKMEILYKTEFTNFINEYYKIFYENMAKSQKIPKEYNKNSNNIIKDLYATRNTLFHADSKQYANVKQDYYKMCRKLNIMENRNIDGLSMLDKDNMKLYFQDEIINYLKSLNNHLSKA